MGISDSNLQKKGCFIFGKAMLLSDESTENLEIKNEIKEKIDSFIGLITVETKINMIQVEIIQELDIEQGRIIYTNVGSKTIQYQILEGITKEEIIQQKNTYGFARCEASQIGQWITEEKKFVPCNWIPNINSPVFLQKVQNYKIEPEAIGHLPSTNYPINIKNINNLITHNTAILGILGIGKSMLAIELVERMVAKKIKVVCVDPTNQYSQELSNYFNTDNNETWIKHVQSIGEQGKTNYQKNVEEGGSKKTFQTEIQTRINQFLDEKTQCSIFIINPNRFEVWKQDSKIYEDKAAMSSLTACEITQIITEATLEKCMSLGMSENARVCVVFEEAHSLIPEWNSVVNEGDKSATNGTSRSILQGRKYGLGCLLITQRTANVTKTILNQCNSIFAMRTFDDTGKDFLANYLGGEYANKLPNLQERHAIFFGRASSCENPVLIRLNDRKDFKSAFFSHKAKK